jgi:hypothetical protein
MRAAYLLFILLLPKAITAGACASLSRADAVLLALSQ